VKRYIGGVDAGLMAGEFEDVTKLGFDGSGSVIGTGWRTEWVWSDPDASDSYWQGVADLNWSFRSGLSLAVEYFYNGRPVPVSTIGPEALVSAQPLYAGRHYTGLLIRQDITPFWQYQVVAIRNGDDASWVYSIPGPPGYLLSIRKSISPLVPNGLAAVIPVNMDDSKP